MQKVYTPPKTNMFPKKGPFRKESSLPTLIFQKTAVSFRADLSVKQPYLWKERKKIRMMSFTTFGSFTVPSKGTTLW